MALHTQGIKRLLLLSLLTANIWILIFAFLCMLKLQVDLNITYLAMSSPLIIGLFIIPVSLHIFLHFETRQLKTAGSCITLFSVYMVIITAILAFILISGKLDEAFDIPWSEVFIPAWISCILLVLYSFFMCPGLIDSTVALYR